jgi:hypothetical protein
VTEHVAGNRFTVVFSAGALQQASAAGVDLPRLAARALDHINALLPGPPARIAVYYATGNDLITQVGTSGVTDSTTGNVTIAFGPTPQASVDKALNWLPRDFSHEVDHTVRARTSSADCCSTLLNQIITEGISSVFDEAAFPGPPNPWDRAISQSQECILWKKAQPLLDQPGLYCPWLVGGGGVPHWTALTIGYDIVGDYRRRHPLASWAALTDADAATILAGSHYQPCSP